MMDKLNSTTQSANAASPKRSESRRKDSSKENGPSQKEGGDFSRELSSVAAPQAQALPAASPVAEAPSALDAGKQFSLRSSAERSPITRTPATSMNAAAAVTGLKPWSREWVFAGNDPIAQAAGARSKPLFGGDDTPAEALEALANGPEGAALAAALAGSPAGLALLSGTRGNAGAKSAAATAPDSAAAANTGQQAGVAGKGANALGAKPDVASLLQQQPLAAAQAGKAGAAIAGESALLPGLAALNGEVLGVDSTGPETGGIPSVNPQANQLSGAEFMSALAAGRMGAKGQDSSNLSGDSGQGQGGQFGGKANLRAIDGLKKPVGLGGREDIVLLAGVEPLRTDDTHVAMPTQVDGRVTQGAATKNRLTSEALLNMTNGIREFAGNGGGEMRVRLKPDSLGELTLRVSTRGNEVRLHIQATDEKARKILEESLPHLKDKLASQNLSLGRVEVSIAQSQAGGGLRQEDPGQNQNQNFQQHPMGDWLGQDQQGRSGQSPDRWSEHDSAFDSEQRPARASVRPGISGLSAAAAGSARGSELESGRIDVRA